MIYLLYGEEYFLIKEKEKEIISKCGIENIISYYFDMTKLEEIINELLYVDLFNEKKLIIINSFSFKELEKKDEELLSKIIDMKQDNILIIKCIDSSLDERKKIIKKIKESCKVYSAKKLDRNELIDYLTNYFKINKYKIDSFLVRKIVNICGYTKYSKDNGYIYNEVNKLMIYKIKDKIITEKDIDLIVSENPENELFTFSSYVIEKDRENMFKRFKMVKELNVDPYLIFNILVRQYRLLFQIKVLKEDKLNNQAISRMLGIHPYIVEIHSNNIGLYTIDELAKIFDQLFETDRMMKSEVVDAYKILEQFLLKI